MNRQESISSDPKNFLSLVSKNWENLDKTQRELLIKIWKIITYKWQLQILFNLPFLIWWALDSSIEKVHNFDMTLLNYLNLPDWALSLIGFGK